MGRQYKIVEKINPWEKITTTYKGFNQRFSDNPERVAVVQIEDSIEVWALDKECNIDHFQEFIKNHECFGKLIGVYKLERPSKEVIFRHLPVGAYFWLDGIKHKKINDLGSILSVINTVKIIDHMDGGVEVCQHIKLDTLVYIF